MTATATRTRPGAGHLEVRSGYWWWRLSETHRDPATGARERRQWRLRVGPVTKLRSHAQARALLDEWRARLDPGTLTPGPDVRFVEYAERFITVHVALMRPSSQRRYRSLIRGWLIPALAGARLHEVDTGRVQRVIAECAPQLSAATVAGLRSTLLQVLRQAARDGFGAHTLNSRDVRLPKSSAPARAPRWITAEELDRILAASPWPWRALWAVMGYAGLRIGEALGVSWAAVDFEHRALHVRQAAVQGRLCAPKTRTSAVPVTLMPQLATILTAYRAIWKPNDAELLFASRTGRPLRADAVRARVWRPLLADLGLPPAGPHALRHGLPARLSATGCPPMLIKRLMRHASVAMTEHYTHGETERLWAELDTIAARMDSRNLPQVAAASVHESHGDAENAAREDRELPRRSLITTEENES